jgi:hypothetical protein
MKCQQPVNGKFEERQNCHFKAPGALLKCVCVYACVRGCASSIVTEARDSVVNVVNRTPLFRGTFCKLSSPASNSSRFVSSECQYDRSADTAVFSCSVHCSHGSSSLPIPCAPPAIPPHTHVSSEAFADAH